MEPSETCALSSSNILINIVMDASMALPVMHYPKLLTIIMPKKIIKKYLPDPETIKQHKNLKIFGALLHNANLWHLNRHSAAGAFAVGLFIAFVPVPFQMLLAAGCAILFQVNLPLSVALVWLSNPVTMPPMFYATYVLGAWILQTPVHPFNFELTIAWLMEAISLYGPAFLLGCFITGTTLSLTGYFSIRWLWRWKIINKWQKRKELRTKK